MRLDQLRVNKNLEPEAYSIGWVPFVHVHIWLDSRPLIPRTETEYWVSQAIEEIGTRGIPNPRILDLCAGSGCIGAAVLKDLSGAHVDFIELDESHHQTIRKNLEANGITEERWQIYGGDLFEKVSGKYDFILTNPPYVDKSLGRVEESVRLYEPDLALDGGEKGLEIIDRILKELPNYLKPEGILYLEHEPEQADHLSQSPHFIESRKDQFGCLRFSLFKPSETGK
jgi:release factor glutamine methyltransferase